MLSVEGENLYGDGVATVAARLEALSSTGSLFIKSIMDFV